MRIEINYEIRNGEIIFIAIAYNDVICKQVESEVERCEDVYILDALKGLQKKLRRRLKEKGK